MTNLLGNLQDFDTKLSHFHTVWRMFTSSDFDYIKKSKFSFGIDKNVVKGALEGEGKAGSGRGGGRWKIRGGVQEMVLVAVKTGECVLIYGFNKVYESTRMIEI